MSFGKGKDAILWPLGCKIFGKKSCHFVGLPESSFCGSHPKTPFCGSKVSILWVSLCNFAYLNMSFLWVSRCHLANLNTSFVSKDVFLWDKRCLFTPLGCKKFLNKRCYFVDLLKSSF